MKNIPLNQMWGLALHQYTLPTGNWTGSKGKATGFGEDMYFSTLRNCLKMEAVVTKHAAIMDKYDKDKKVALLVDEWGCVPTWSPAPTPVSCTNRTPYATQWPSTAPKSAATSWQ